VEITRFFSAWCAADICSSEQKLNKKDTLLVHYPSGGYLNYTAVSL